MINYDPNGYEKKVKLLLSVPELKVITDSLKTTNESHKRMLKDISSESAYKVMEGLIVKYEYMINSLKKYYED